MKMTGIYCIENICNGKRYIGQSINLKTRRNQHFKDLKNNRHRNSKLQADYNKYGKDNFKFFVLKICCENELDELEKYYIDMFRQKGLAYNKMDGGNNRKHFSDAEKEHLSIVQRGKNNKLTVEDVKKIRLEYLHGKKTAEIAQEYNVDLTTIDKVIHYKNWSWVAPELQDEINQYIQKQKDEREKELSAKKQEAIKLFQLGYDKQKIAATLDVYIKYVSSWLYEMYNTKIEEQKQKKESIVNDFKNGLTKKEIMEKYQISSCVYGRITHFAYIEKKEADKEKAIKMREQGYKVQDIAKIMNLHRTTVTEWTKHLSPGIRHANTEVSSQIA